MSKFFNFLEKNKFGVLAAIGLYIGLFIYFQLTTYEKLYVIPIWDERADIEIPEEIELKPENIEVNAANTNSEVKSISQSSTEKREKSLDNWSPNKIAKSAEQNIKDLEKQFFKESGGGAKRDKILEEAQKNKEKSNVNSTTKNSNAMPGSEKAYAGSVMVDWRLSNREPHQNNSWHIRNPGYTCGEGSSGKITIKIKVDNSGYVTSAVFMPELSTSSNSCMLEQAKKYALMSRFNYVNVNSKTQEGTISYTFVSQ